MFFCKFLTFDTRKLAPKKLHVNRHTQFKIWHVVWLVKKKKYTSIDTLIIEMICIPRHVTLEWHLDENVDVKWHSFFVSENVTRHFGFKVEHQMTFVKHTHTALNAALENNRQWTPQSKDLDALYRSGVEFSGRIWGRFEWDKKSNQRFREHLIQAKMLKWLNFWSGLELVGEQLEVALYNQLPVFLWFVWLRFE